MHIPTDIPFTNASRRLVSALQPRPRRSSSVRPKHIPIQRIISIPHFDADSERLFRQECQTDTLNALKTLLLLGAICFLAFVVLDVFNSGLSKSEIIDSLLVMLTLSILLLSLHRLPQPESQINSVAKLSVALSVIDLSSILLIEGNPVFYAEIWIGLLPVYFFIYGQMFMTIAETLTFGLLAMIALPLCGHLLGVESTFLRSAKK